MFPNLSNVAEDLTIKRSKNHSYLETRPVQTGFKIAVRTGILRQINDPNYANIIVFKA